ncbi:hypothetical protein ES703_121797 [subsurface metagenome]
MVEAGVVDQGVDAPERFYRLPGHFFGGGFGGNVGVEGDGGAARRLDFGYDRLRFLVGDIGDYYPGAFLSHPQAVGFAQPVGAAGYYGYLVV